MDLAGLAALFALPAGLIAALAPAFQERTWAAHLDRVVRLLESDVKLGDLEEQMLVSVRGRLVERIAIATLLPRMLTTLILGVVMLASAPAYFFAILFESSDLRGELARNSLQTGTEEAVAFALIGVLTLLIRRGIRDKRLIELRTTGTVRQREPEDIFQLRTEPLFRRRKRNRQQPPQE